MEKRWLRFIGRARLKKINVIWLTLSIIVLQSCTTLKRHSFNKSNDLVQDDYFYTEKIVSNNQEFQKKNLNEKRQIIDSNFITNGLDSLQIIPTKQGFKTTPKKLLLKLKDANNIQKKLKEKGNYVNDTWGIIAFISVIASIGSWILFFYFPEVFFLLILGILSLLFAMVALYISVNRKRHQRKMFKYKGFGIATGVILLLASIALVVGIHFLLKVWFP
jgi:magnesium-transporting ATPase (P-type)